GGRAGGGRGHFGCGRDVGRCCWRFGRHGVRLRRYGFGVGLRRYSGGLKCFGQRGLGLDGFGRYGFGLGPLGWGFCVGFGLGRCGWDVGLGPLGRSFGHG
ncbi:hypothetical protein D7X74_32325, partial [Corallococcus sp. CA047B]